MPGSSGVLGTPRGTEGGPAPSGAVLGGRVGGGGGTVEEGCGGEDTGTVRAQLGGAGEGLLGPRKGIRESQRREGNSPGVDEKAPCKVGTTALLNVTMCWDRASLFGGEVNLCVSF